MKIALIGYGKMGKIIEQVAIARGHEIVSKIDVDNQDDFNSPNFKSADIAIEFTAPAVAIAIASTSFSNLEIVFDNKFFNSSRFFGV